MSNQEKSEKIKDRAINATFGIITALIVSSVIGSYNKVNGSASKEDVKVSYQESKSYTDMQIKNVSDRMLRYEYNLSNMATKQDIETLKEMIQQQNDNTKTSIDLLKELSKNRR